MKRFFNYRYATLAALFCVGIISLALAFGDPAEWLTLRAYFAIATASAAVSVCSFATLIALVKHWAAKGKIDELMNFVKEED